jgi:hypothetical protein
MTGKSIWRLCKVYGRMISYPELTPHDLRHGVAMEVLEQHHDLEEVRALLSHARIDTTQVYTSIRPPQLKGAVEFYDDKVGFCFWMPSHAQRDAVAAAPRAARVRVWQITSYYVMGTGTPRGATAAGGA